MLSAHCCDFGWKRGLVRWRGESVAVVCRSKRKKIEFIVLSAEKIVKCKMFYPKKNNYSLIGCNTYCKPNCCIDLKKKEKGLEKVSLKVSVFNFMNRSVGLVEIQTCWWCWMKSQGITSVNRIHSLDVLEYLFKKFVHHPSKSCWDFNLWLNKVVVSVKSTVQFFPTGHCCRLECYLFSHHLSSRVLCFRARTLGSRCTRSWWKWQMNSTL